MGNTVETRNANEAEVEIDSEGVEAEIGVSAKEVEAEVETDSEGVEAEIGVS